MIKFIKQLIEFLVTESYVVARTSINGLLKGPEQDILKNNDKLVVFIKGYGIFWRYSGISTYLKNRNFDLIFLDYKTLGVSNIDEYSKEINKKILSVGKKYERIDLIGFSLGGVAAINYLNKYPNKIRTLITISTPFSGSYFANLPFMDSISNDMKPNSQILKNIQLRNLTNKTQIVCASPIWDQFCVFTKYETPKYAESIKLKALGHNSAMRIEVTKHLFDKYL